MAVYQFSSLVSVKDFKEQVTSTIQAEDTGIERCPMDKLKISSEMGITEETLTELQDVCGYAVLQYACFAQDFE